MDGKLARPIIFGLSDGAMSIVGVVLYASGHSEMVLPLAVSGGVSASISMAGGEWLSDSENGFWASAAMGAATLAGSVAPAIPYVFLKGAEAYAVAGVMLVGVAAIVARLRKNREHPYRETGLVLSAVLLASILCSIFI
jgi:VIT1/CCC1 family predicted Fe2+/Mn2+ transporter